jgi:hypothetical protein
MMEAARTSETSIDIDLSTRQYIPEDSELYTELLIMNAGGTYLPRGFKGLISNGL